MVSEVAASKPINLYQLSREISVEAPPALRLGGGVLRSDIAQAALEAAVEAHVADPAIAPPPPPPPLIDPAEFPPEDERVAADALLTEDSVGFRAVIGLLIAKGVITEAEVAAAQAAALQRLVVLADRPDVRRQMMAERIGRAEQARQG